MPSSGENDLRKCARFFVSRARHLIAPDESAYKTCGSISDLSADADG